MHWMRFYRTSARQVSRQRIATRLILLAWIADSAFPQDTTLRTRSNLVLIPVLLKDKQDGIVYGLQAKDFVVEDDGVEQKIRLDEAPEGQPVSLVLAIQTGRRASYEFPRMQGLKTMLDPLFELGTTRMAVVEFDSRIDLVRNFSTDQ